MKKFVPVLILFFCYSCSSNQEKFPLKLIPVQQGEYWGFIDKDGKMVINPQFKYAYAFKDGLALVESTEEKFGYINEEGKIVIPAVYTDASSFSEGLAATVKENQKVEFIDKTGKTVLTLDSKIEKVYDFKEGLAKAEVDGKESFIDKDGKVVITGDYKEVESFSEGLALFSQKVNDETSYGYLDKTGKIAINPQFEGATSFSEGKARIEKDDKYGYIDKAGKIIIQPQFERAYLFSQNMAAVKQGELWGFITDDGKFAINPQFKRVGSFTVNGYCAVMPVSGEKWGFIDKKGKTVIDAQYDEVSGFISGVSVVKFGEKYGVVDTKGKYLANPLYKNAGIPYDSDGGVESDYFDIAAITNMLFKNSSALGFKDLNTETNFRNLQAKFPGLTHENYNKYSLTPAQSNSSLDLDYMGFDLGTAFYHYDNGSKKLVYNDDSKMKVVFYVFKFKDEASDKADEVIDLIGKNAPVEYLKQRIDKNSMVFDGNGQSTAIIKEGETLIMGVTFDKHNFDTLREKKDDDDDYPAKADSAKSMVQDTAAVKMK